MKVIVLYEWPKAKPDIFKWAEEHNLYIDPTDNSWEVSEKGDDIIIL